MFKNAKWITMPQVVDRNESRATAEDSSVYIRKSFAVDKTVKSATAYVCAVGLGVWTINGENISDEVLTTPFTAYDKRLIYQTYDIKDKLKSGENVIAVHIGNGYYNDTTITWNNSTAAWRSQAKMVARIDIEYCDGSDETILSDTSWQAEFGPCIYNAPRQGEIYDFNLKKNGFDCPGFDISGWKNAVITKAPGGVLEPMDMPPIRVIRTVKPVSEKDGIYDFGENISGWVRIKATGEKGQKMHIKYDECIKDDGEFLGYIDVFNEYDKNRLSHEAYITFSGEGKEEYAPSFVYHGFRYAKVENAPSDLEIVAEVVHTDFERTAAFECSDDMLNKIHRASVNSTLANYVGIPTDCPHREQNGWTGDALVSSHQSLKNFDMYKAYRKWLRDFKDAQRPSGQLPGIIPTTGWGYEWGCGPAWDSALILMPLYIYHATGKTEIIRDMWENIVLYMEFIHSMSEDYIVDFGLGDWLAAEGTDVCPTVITDTAYYYADAKACAKMAELIGEDSSQWSELALNIRNKWREKFLDRPEHFNKQTYFACAIYRGLLNEDEVPVYAKKLAELVKENGYHIACGLIGTKYIFDSLSDNGYSDVIYKMISVPDMPSFAYFINNGLTTLPETWDMTCSLNHHMFSEVDNWMYKHLGGFDFEDGKVVITPKPFDDIEWVKVSWRDVKIERNGRNYNLTTERNIVLRLNGEERTLDAGTYNFKL